MITVRVEVPYASFRKSYARSFAETYPFPPPATVYGMLLSLVGERFRRRHAGVRLAFAYKCRSENGDCNRDCVPRIATTLRKLSRFKYGVSTHSGHKPDYVETLCGIEFLCWVDSSEEQPEFRSGGSGSSDSRTLEERIVEAIKFPDNVSRYGVLSLGLSDDAVNDVGLCMRTKGEWHRLLPSDTGEIELPVLVQHVGAARTKWQRYRWEVTAVNEPTPPDGTTWQWTSMDYLRAA
ncbi:MAG TPA: CRISPR-associated protein Cas5 [Pyrinomonadaceae bacterium]|nr:CRISPR-associated protein Cas5 [Pyrinomonadaceae bacterium]